MSSMDLRVFLVMHRLSQEKFGMLVGVSRQSVNAWCTDKFRIPQRVVDFCREYKDDTNNKK